MLYYNYVSASESADTLVNAQRQNMHYLLVSLLEKITFTDLIWENILYLSVKKRIMKKTG